MVRSTTIIKLFLVSVLARNKEQILLKNRESVRLLLLTSGSAAEISWNVLLKTESSEPISDRHLATDRDYHSLLH